MPGAGNRIAYYRDDKGLEVDVIIELSDGRWGAIEIKLSDLKVNDDNADKLKSFRNKICGNPMAQVRDPEFMMFLTGRGGKAYRRNDGILVVPIATLEPRKRLSAQGPLAAAKNGARGLSTVRRGYLV